MGLFSKKKKDKWKPKTTQYKYKLPTQEEFGLAGVNIDAIIEEEKAFRSMERPTAFLKVVGVVAKIGNVLIPFVIFFGLLLSFILMQVLMMGDLSMSAKVMANPLYALFVLLMVVSFGSVFLDEKYWQKRPFPKQDTLDKIGKYQEAMKEYNYWQKQKASRKAELEREEAEERAAEEAARGEQK